MANSLFFKMGITTKIKKIITMTNLFLRWADKSYSLLLFENGYVSVGNDHSPMDGMTIVISSAWIQLGVDDQKDGKCKFPWEGKKFEGPPVTPQQLHFQMTQRLR